MEGTLEDYYVTTNMVAERWKAAGYKTKQKKEWDANSVRNKFKWILRRLDDLASINDSSEDSSEDSGEDSSEEKIEKLEIMYRSENGEGKGHFIFQNISDIIESDQGRKGTPIVEYNQICFAEFYNNYETDTYELLNNIFKLWDSVKGIDYFKYSDVVEFSTMMGNLMPQNRNINELKKAIDCVERKNIESYKAFSALEEQCLEEKKMVREHIYRAFMNSRKDIFYKKRIFVKDRRIQNGQKELLIEWYNKWTYVIDNIIEIYKVLNEEIISLEDVIKVLLIWYQDEKMRKLISEEKYKSDFNKSDFKEKLFEDLSYNKFVGDCMEMVSGLCNYRHSEFRKKAENDHLFIIVWAFDDLEEIHEQVIDNIQLLKKNEEKDLPPTNILSYIKTCIGIMKPDDIERINMAADYM